MTPDEFNDSARTWMLLLMRDQPVIGAAVTFADGYKFASDVALKMTDIYRRAASNAVRQS